jgi:predicted nucleic acid-binding protein
MSGKFFLDTNIFVYASEDTDPSKQARALELIELATMDRNGVISYQVIQEFFNAVLRKALHKMRPGDAQLYLSTVFRPLLAVHSSVALFGDAIRLQERYRLSWYDSLIVAAAQQSNCDILYTEDMQDGQQFGDLLIQNPFR